MLRIKSWETRHENAEAVRLLGLAPHHAVLEVGFGHGRSLCALLQRTPQDRVMAMDWPGDAVAWARARYVRAISCGRLEMRQGDAGLMPFGEATVDCMLSTHTVCLWNDAKMVLRELHRMVRPGRRLVLTFNEPDSAHVATRFPSPTYRSRSEAELSRAALEPGGRPSVQNGNPSPSAP